MSMSGDDAYVLAMDYVDETLEGGGALKGDDGKSAYQSWLDLGNTGTEEDFIDSLKGADGQPGANGEKGDPGEKGDNGKSAYQYAQDGGYIGTETEFTTNIARSGVISKELEVERVRIDNLTTLQDGSTTGDAELIDARIDKDGNTHVNVGEHIRTVSSQISNDIAYNVKSNGQYSDLYIEYNLDGFYENNGTFNPVDNTNLSYSSNYKATSLVECGEGDRFIVTATHGGNVQSITVFDENKKFLVGALTGDGSAERTTNYEYTVPSKGRYIAFCTWGEAIAIIKKPEKVSQALKSMSNEMNRKINKVIDVTGNLIDGYIESATGLLSEDIGLATDYIPFKINDVFLVSGNSQYASCVIAVYDNDKKFITSYCNGTSENNLLRDYEFSTNKYSGYIRVSSLSFCPKVKKIIAVDNEEISNIFTYGKSVLYGKKYIALGDSFTHGDWSGWVDENGRSGEMSSDIFDSALNVFKTYPYWIATRNNMQLTNLAINGGKLVQEVVGQEVYKQISNDCDYATIMIGLNDTSIDNPIGTIDDTSATTVYGCWNTMLSWLRENRPNLHFGIIIVSAYLSEDFRNATINVAKKYGYPILDMYNDESIPAFMGYIAHLPAKNGMDISVSDAITLKRQVNDTNMHPNLEAHKFISGFIEDFLCRL